MAAALINSSSLLIRFLMIRLR